MRHVVAIYVDVLLGLLHDRAWTVLVHPVPPVLNETRPIVLLYNRVLKQRILAAAKSARGAGRLHWLDFLPSLLEPAGDSELSAAAAAAVAAAKASEVWRLRPGMELDGTHLSPSYVAVLDQALGALSLS